jgi:hypothetical protein
MSDWSPCLPVQQVSILLASRVQADTPLRQLTLKGFLESRFIFACRPACHRSENEKN